MRMLTRGACADDPPSPALAPPTVIPWALNGVCQNHDNILDQHCVRARADRPWSRTPLGQAVLVELGGAVPGTIPTSGGGSDLAVTNTSARRIAIVYPFGSRRGEALLAGLLRCGHCGRKLHVAYSGENGNSGRYHCRGGD